MWPKSRLVEFITGIECINKNLQNQIKLAAAVAVELQLCACHVRRLCIVVLLSHFPLPSVSCNLKQVNFGIRITSDRFIAFLWLSFVKQHRKTLRSNIWIATFQPLPCLHIRSHTDISFCVLPLYKFYMECSLIRTYVAPRSDGVSCHDRPSIYIHLYNILFDECSVYTLTESVRGEAILSCIFKYAQLTWYGQFSLEL